MDPIKVRKERVCTFPATTSTFHQLLRAFLNLLSTPTQLQLMADDLTISLAVFCVAYFISAEFKIACPFVYYVVLAIKILSFIFIVIQLVHLAYDKVRKPERRRYR